MMFLRINLEYVDTSKVLKHVLFNIIFGFVIQKLVFILGQLRGL